MGDQDKKEIRLQLFLARAGIGSRRKCETFIDEGRVTVNGRRVTEQGVKVGPGDKVTMDGKPVGTREKHKYIALNKPKGYVCSNYDPKNRPLAVDLCRPAVQERIYSIGRLDLNSSGLLILTNDGHFAEKIAHPRNEIEKVYLVESKEPVSAEGLDQYKKGIVIEGIRYVLKDYHFKTPRKVNLTLIEGKNREIRRVYEYFNWPISRIHRIRIGPVQVRGIPSGGFRFLTRNEISLLSKGSRKEK
ncbi:MAG: pseudouridine synthase [Spirochaetia bacterium]